MGEWNIFGLLVSPLLPCAGFGWLLSFFVRRRLVKTGFYVLVWHESLFNLSLLIICTGVVLELVRLIGNCFI